MQPMTRSFVTPVLFALALGPLACASAPPTPVTTPAPGSSGGAPITGGSALPECPAGAVDGGACSEQGQHCSVASGAGPLQCAADGHWIVTPPCCKK